MRMVSSVRGLGVLFTIRNVFFFLISPLISLAYIYLYEGLLIVVVSFVIT